MTEAVVLGTRGCETEEPDTERRRAMLDIDSTNRAAWETRLSHPAQARDMFLDAARRSATGDFALRPYREGQAFALAGQALMFLVEGHHEAAATHALEAMSSVADGPLSEAEICARIVLTWIDIYLGENAKALESALEILRTSKELGSAYWEARSNILVGTVYRNMGSGQQALQTQTRALQMCREHPMPDNEVMVLHHISDTLLFLGDLAGSLEKATESLATARERGFGIAEFMASINVVETLVALGEPDRAIPYLPRLRSLIPPEDRSVFRVNYHQVAGKVASARRDDRQAEFEFKQALEFATQLKANGDMSVCHSLLASLYESHGDFRRALDHFKLFNELQQVVNGEKTRQRVAVLNTVHQLETAQRDAELYRAHNTELMREIEERKKLEAQLARLASHDPLTQLFNRGHFLELAQREVARAGRSGQASSFLFLDVDYFKQINDRFGHLVGDQVLASIAQVLRRAVREIDIVGRLGGEEFAIVLPETAIRRAYDVAERIRVMFSQQPIATDQGDIAITLSIGVASLTTAFGPDPDSLTDVIQRADEALYRAKRAGRNRTEVQLE